MASDDARSRLARVSADRIRRDLFHLSKDPLPFRKLNYTVPGRDRCTLYEADEFIRTQLQAAGWEVDSDAVQVQAFRCDTSKPKAQQYSRPAPEDPWYAAYNVWGRKRGTQHPDEIIVLCAHKDSQSWVDSPGAHDNAGGTSGLMELGRALSDYEPKRSIWLLFCNEEHTPWTSVAAAEGCRDRGDNLIAVLNCDGFGARTEQQVEVDEKSNGVRYTLDEGKWLADLVVQMNEQYGIGLTQYVSKRDRPGDDDGSFVKAGFASAIFNGGGGAGTYPYYHREDDVPENVDIESLHKLTQVTLAAVLHLDAEGAPAT